MTTDESRQSVEEAAAAIRRGRMAVVAGQRDVGFVVALVGPVDGLTAAHVNFMIGTARGPLYVTLQDERLEQLRLAVVRSTESGPDRRAIHVPVDVRAGTRTGLSAADRAATIRALANPASRSGDFRIPGHVTPIGCRKGGVLERTGHTEATVDLMRLAGCSPAAVVCPLLAENGDAATPDDARHFAAAHGLPLVGIDEIVHYRRWLEDVIVRVGETVLPLPEGRFRAIGYRDPYVSGEHMALVCGDLDESARVAVHVHAECLAADALGVQACDCRSHLREAMRLISEQGTGILLYLRAPGGDAGKLRHLVVVGDHADEPDPGRPRGVAISILRDLGIDADRAALV